MPIGLRLTTAPTEEPVSLAEARNRLRVTISDDDADITAHIREATRLAEAECGGRAFVTQTWTLYLDDFPRGRGEIRVPKPPLQSVTYVKYYDTSGVQQTFSSSNYYVATGCDPGRIALKDSASWPTVESNRPEAVEIKFVCGYGQRVSVPDEVKSAILLILADRYCGTDAGGSGVGIPDAARRVLNTLEFGEVR